MSRCAGQGFDDSGGREAMAHDELQPLPLGTRVHDRYAIFAVVGQGGLGTVYQVSDTAGNGTVFALKEMADPSRSARKQFTQEARWLQTISHAHIPKVHASFEWKQRLYLVLDYVDGENLEQKLRRCGGRPLPERQVLAWILPVCDALQYLHSRRPPILHRDVKPANIIIRPDNHPVLVDFGIAKEHRPGANQTATFVRKAGTEGYAPPEQYTSAGQSGPWSDVYALGATLYELLTGCVPPTALERVALDARLVPPRELNPTISPYVAAAITQAIALRPTERFPLVAEFAAVLLGPSSAPLVGATLPRMASVAYTPPTPAPYAPSSSDPGNRSNGSGRMPSSWPPHIAHAPPPAGPPPAGPPPTSPPPASMPSGPRISADLFPTWSSPSHALSRPPAPTPASDALVDAAIGGATSQQRTPASGSDVGTLAPHRRGPRLSLPVLGALVVAILFVAAVVFHAAILRAVVPPDRSTPQATVTGYFGALAAQDAQRAWQFVAANRSDVSSQRTFESNLLADDARDGRVLRWQIAQLTGASTGQAVVTVEVWRAGAPSTPVQYVLALTQYDGTTWLIDSISTS